MTSDASRSPVSDDGRGLKQYVHACLKKLGRRSPVSDDGRGLKHHVPRWSERILGRSPVSDDGRGLKPSRRAGRPGHLLVRPSVMTGVD